MFTKVLYMASSTSADTDLNHHPQWAEVEVPLEQVVAAGEAGLEVPRVRHLCIKSDQEEQQV